MSRLTREDVVRFAYGEADELEEVILGDPEYLSWVEEIWAQELPRDLTPAVMRAVQLQRLVTDTATAAFDVARLMGSALLRYGLRVREDGEPTL
ncbi:MAG: hypothetical protein KatS3mg011_0774 [Acidimicrobiia bacterium]|nr:MAG: hypothetical protein KatS3mg011_0774 [Acidimicrobiia bacterium]